MNNKPISRIRRLQRGITLVELISTLSIAAVLFSVAVPSLSSLTANNRMTSATNSLVRQLNLARSEAIKRGNKVVLCPSSNGADCNDSFEWHQGLMVFIDRDNDKVRDSGEEILQVEIPFSERISIKTSTGRKILWYMPTGSSGGSNTTFKFCHLSDRTDPRKVVLSPTGRPRVAGDSQGDPVDCS